MQRRIHSPLRAFRELPVNVVLTYGYAADPRPSSRYRPMSWSSSLCLRRCCCQGADETSYATAAAKIRSEIELLPDPSAVVEELTSRAAGRGF
jgi:hypothetical protein